MTEFSLLLNKVNYWVSVERVKTIGIDGFMGSGKTYLAEQLEENINAKRIELDSYLVRGGKGDGYLNRFDFEKLITDYRNALLGGSVVFIDGICLLDVISKIGINLDRSIYIKKLGSNDYWYDGLDLDLFLESSQVCSPLGQSELVYHKEYTPHRNSNFIFVRSE